MTTDALDLLTRISSESDSAALAPLQQGFCGSALVTVQNVSMIVPLNPVPSSLRDRSLVVLAVKESPAC